MVVNLSVVVHALLIRPMLTSIGEIVCVIEGKWLYTTYFANAYVKDAFWSNKENKSEITGSSKISNSRRPQTFYEYKTNHKRKK